MTEAHPEGPEIIDAKKLPLITEISRIFTKFSTVFAGNSNEFDLARIEASDKKYAADYPMAALPPNPDS